MKENKYIHISTSTGELLFADQIISLVPSTIFSSDLHIETCTIIANSIKDYSGDRRKVFINLLARKSTQARALTALRFIYINKIITLKEIFLHVNLAIACEYLFSIPIYSIKNPCTNLIDSPSKMVLSAKYLYHKLYRIIGWRLRWKTIRNDSIVRSFVEVTERIHKNQLKNSLCLFFPFPYKMSRQLSFYKECKQKKYQVAFFGVPYSLKNLIIILFKRTDNYIVNFEYEAHAKHGVELSRLELKHYYTEDDYDASSFLIANELIKSGCEVINTAHGVNQTCPYINCSIFELLTRPQYDFYTSLVHNKHISFIFQKNNIVSDSESFVTNNETKFVFVHGNFKESDLKYESKMQTKIIMELEKYINLYQIYIKYHPNGIFFETTKIPILKSFEDLDNKSNIVFLTVNSTSFYTYYHLGPFVFIGDDYCNPFNIVDKEVPFFHYNQVEKVLMEYSNSEFFLKKRKIQHILIKKIQNGLVD